MTESKFVVVGGKVVPNRSVDVVQKCQMCSIRERQIATLKLELSDEKKKVGALKDDIERARMSNTVRKDASRARDVEKRVMNESLSTFAKDLCLFMAYIRVVLWTLKALRDNPPGGFCVACEHKDDQHEKTCPIANLFERPEMVILHGKDMPIMERDLPIPPTLRAEVIAPLVDRPWSLHLDMNKECRECHSHPLRGKLFCNQHMPKEAT